MKSRTGFPVKISNTCTSALRLKEWYERKKMPTFRNYILSPRQDEASYEANIGFQEMAMFYQKATHKQIEEMERIVRSEDWDGFKNMIRKVTGVKLK
jgi:hypothetical protein